MMLVRSAAALAAMRPVLLLRALKESSAAISKPRCVWLRVLIFKDLEKAHRLPVRVEASVTSAVSSVDDDDVYYYIDEDDERLKLEGETENMGVCAKERKGTTARYYG